MLAYCCICRQMAADDGSLHRFPQNPKCLAIWEEKLAQLTAVASVQCSVAFMDMLLLDWKIF